jgi:hypothetical protein
MSTRERIVALEPRGKGILAYTLRTDAEVRKADEIFDGDQRQGRRPSDDRHRPEDHRAAGRPVRSQPVRRSLRGGAQGADRRQAEGPQDRQGRGARGHQCHRPDGRPARQPRRPRTPRLPARSFAVDGELLVAVDGAFVFETLQMRLHPAESRIRRLAAESPAVLALFDMLQAPDGGDLRAAPWTSRHEALTRFHGLYGGPRLSLTPGTADRSLAQAWLDEGKLEGVVAKRMDGPYAEGERSMIKVKRQRTADCVVGGFRYGRDSKLVGSLLLGLYDAEGRLNHGFARSSISTWTPSMRRSNSAMIPACAAARSRSATARGAAWSPPPATRPAQVRRPLGHALDHGLAQVPELVFVPPRFEVYKAVSRQIHAIFADYTDLIEPLSLDEAYLDVTANRAAWRPPRRPPRRSAPASWRDGPDGLGRDLLQQVPGQAGLGPAQAQRPVRGPARQGRGLRPDPADRPLPWRGRGHRSQDEAPGHPHRRGPAPPESWPSCSSISASPGPGITPSPAARTTGRSIPTASASRPARRPPSTRT